MPLDWLLRPRFFQHTKLPVAPAKTNYIIPWAAGPPPMELFASSTTDPTPNVSFPYDGGSL